MSPLWSAAELAAIFGQPCAFDVSGISFDTRTLAPGDLFVALSDARDGHEFVAAAFAKGAAGALVSRPTTGAVLLVDDTLAGLRRLAAAGRARARAKIIAVTGSVGKTTTKEMLRRMLSGFGTVHAAAASFNNHIGVPLTLACLPPNADFGIFEIGMNHPGEIAPLASLVRPDVAIITAIARAHIGLMGSEKAIAVEKASIFGALAPGGVAIYPAGTAHEALLATAVPAGVQALAAGGPTARLVALEQTGQDSRLTVELGGVTASLTLDAPGAHMAENALTALAAAAALGLDIAQAAAALDGFAPVAGRGARRPLAVPGGQAWLLDESYNASPSAVRAALSVLALQPGRHVAVLGDMLEMGEHALTEHLALAPAVLAAADLVFTCGPEMRALFDSVPAAKQGAHAPDAASLALIVRAALRPGDVVLVKGSYGSRMRDVVLLLESPV
jgi:UDP-N-acetylmuramoyl-tripeptide--D-alanyl-D-alanine ligase